ncbi:MAG: DegT/DnrJ/EryC1/StrS family aminotransferase [Treponema sp.]|jgi:dTDP-4-amino-4,6-dideoxygalactose transaminase|nr:DegT/DnrJ/EryC1/StrS family aminotransferase [Treponema sp.]
MKIEVYSPTVRRKEMDAVLTAMVEDRLGPGEHTRFLIHTAREQLGFDYCLALRSPVFALTLALRAVCAGANDRKNVVLSALSPLYYEQVIQQLGLTPLYCDTDSDQPLVSSGRLQSLLEFKPACVIVHHALGYQLDPELAGSLGIPVIEDCSPSVGGLWAETKAGCSGAFTILGLEERDLITAGGGALLFTGKREYSSQLRSLGELPPEYLLPDLNAAMAAVQFHEMGKNLEKRREIADAYIRASLQTRHKRFALREGQSYNNYAFSLVLESGVKDVKAYAKKKDIAVEEAFEGTLAGSGVIPAAQCPLATSLALRTVVFPLYPRLGASAAEKVAKLIGTLP